MKAVVYSGPLTIELRDVEPPQAGEEEVLVAVAAVGICGSELEGFANQSPFRIPPLIMGHEFSGHLADGSLVVVNPLVWCGHCDLCLRGMQNICRRRQIIGVHQPGGYAERVVVPAHNVYSAIPGMTPVTGALVEPVANAVHAVRLAMQVDSAPMRLGVIGGGALGLCSAIVALNRGIPEVAACDLSDMRQDTLRRVGVHEVGAVLEGEFDVIIDAVGSARTRSDSMSMIRPGGTVVWLGLHEPEPGFDGLALVRGEKRAQGSFCYTDADFRAAMPIAASIDPFWVASRPLADGDEVFRTLLTGPVAASKTMLVPGL